MLTTVLASLTVGLALAAALFVWYRHRRPATYLGSDEIDGFALSTMSTRSFESMVIEAFRHQGYRASTTYRGGAGELLLRRDHETCVVDCRRWRDPKVGVEAIESLQRAMRSRGAGSGFAITRGRYSRAATAAARVANIRLIEGRALKVLIQQAAGSAE